MKRGARECETTAPSVAYAFVIMLSTETTLVPAVRYGEMYRVLGACQMLKACLLAAFCAHWNGSSCIQSGRDEGGGAILSICCLLLIPWQLLYCLYESPLPLLLFYRVMGGAVLMSAALLLAMYDEDRVHGSFDTPSCVCLQFAGVPTRAVGLSEHLACVLSALRSSMMMAFGLFSILFLSPRDFYGIWLFIPLVWCDLFDWQNRCDDNKRTLMEGVSYIHPATQYWYL